MHAPSCADSRILPRFSRRWRRVQRPLLKLPVALEQRVFDGARGHAEAASVKSERAEILLPLVDGEALAATVGDDGADGEQELPGADVEHAVASRIDKGQDGRGHR